MLAPVRLVVQVMKFADLGIATLQQLDVELGRNGLQLRGCDLQRNAIHALAPRPKVVMCRLAPLGQAGKRALERVAVGVDQRRQHRPGEPGCVRRRLDVGADLVEAAVRADTQQNARAPAAVNPGLRGPPGLAHSAFSKQTLNGSPT